LKNRLKTVSALIEAIDLSIAVLITSSQKVSEMIGVKNVPSGNNKSNLIK